jgi:putative addiction module component (TIGR02574 family)
MRTIEQLTEELLALPSASRAMLAEKLVESLELDIDPNIQAAWVAEVERRHNEILDGTVQPIEGDEALAQVRRLLES